MNDSPTYQLMIYGGMVLWGLISLTMISRMAVKRDTNKVNLHLYDAIPTVFTTLGVLGTFLGIYYGLADFETDNIDGSIEALLKGLKTAFLTSIIGIIAALVFGRLAEFAYRFAERSTPAAASDELSALNELIRLTREGSKATHEHLQKVNASLIGENESSVATQIVKLRNKFSDLEAINNQQADALVEVRDALGGSDDTSLLSQVQRLRAEQKDVGDRINRTVTTVMDTMTENSKLLHDKFDEFAKLLEKSNTEALVDVMQKATEEFNKQMKAIVEKLVQENFEQLNSSVERMNTWQQQNKDMIATLTEQFRQVSENIESSSKSISEITNNTERLTEANGILAQLIQKLKAVMIDDVRFEEVTTQLLDNANLLKENTEAFDETTSKLNDWIQKEHNFRDAVTALIARLEDFQKIKDYNEEFWAGTKRQMSEGVGILNQSSRELNNNLDNISMTFNRQLSDTLTSLDQLIQRIIQDRNAR